MKIKIDHQEIAFTEYGNPKGFPILAQHGLIASIRDGELFDTLIKNQNVRVICIARPGYGESSPIVMNNIGEWGNLVKHLTDQLGIEHFDVLGMSSGAPYAYAIARELEKQTRNIFIFSGIPAMYDDDVLAKWPFPVKKNASLEEMQTLAMELFFSNPTIEDLARNDYSDSMANQAFGLAQDFRLRCMDWGFKLGEINQPVFMRHARNDMNVPFATAQITSKLLPNCRLQVEENDIHFSTDSLEAYFSATILPNIP